MAASVTSGLVIHPHDGRVLIVAGTATACTSTQTKFRSVRFQMLATETGCVGTSSANWDTTTPSGTMRGLIISDGQGNASEFQSITVTAPPANESGVKGGVGTRPYIDLTECYVDGPTDNHNVFWFGTE